MYVYCLTLKRSIYAYMSDSSTRQLVVSKRVADTLKKKEDIEYLPQRAGKAGTLPDPLQKIGNQLECVKLLYLDHSANDTEWKEEGKILIRKEINSKIEFSSDFIIGYPGEEIEDFENTMKLIDRIKFINSYSFIFSARPGTTASKLKSIDDKISKQRLKIVQEKLFGYQILKNKSLENKYIDVLIENEMKGQNKLFGRNQYMNSVIVEGNKNLIGKIIQVKITKSNQNTLFGEIDRKKTIQAA